MYMCTFSVQTQKDGYTTDLVGIPQTVLIESFSPQSACSLFLGTVHLVLAPGLTVSGLYAVRLSCIQGPLGILSSVMGPGNLLRLT